MWLAAIAGVVCADPLRADDAPGFTARVAPVLVQKCQGCHGPDKAKGGYRVDTFERLTKPGDGGGAPVVPGEPDKSELFVRVTSHDKDKRMPQKDDPLPPAQVAAIGAWIKAGAKFDGPDRTAPLATLVPDANSPHPPAPRAYPRPVPVLALAFAPDGKALVAGGYHEVTVWDPADGRLLRRIGNVPRQVHSLAYSPDGSLLAVAGGTPGGAGEVRVISVNGPADSAAPGASRVFERGADVMFCAAFSPDGARLAAGGADGAVRVYDVVTGRRELLVEHHADWVTAVAFSPDGRRLASASRDKSVRVVDAKTGEAESAYLGHEAPVFTVDWINVGKYVVSGGRDHEVHVWEPAAEGKKRAEAGGFAGDVLRLVAGGGEVFVTSADGKVRQFAPVRDKPGLQLTRVFDVAPDWAYGLAFDAKTSRVAAGAFDGTVRVFSVVDGTPVSTFVAAPGYSPGARTPSAITPSKTSGG